MTRTTLSHREEEIIGKVINILQKHLPLNHIILFGSRGKGTAHPGSDFDFAVDTARPAFRVEEKIKDQIENAAGLHGVDVVYLQEVDNDFKKIVLKTGRVIYERRT